MDKDQNKISTVIITLNEEKKIERCLKSVSEISDEIIVVDSFSTDKTQEICERYNVKFIEHKFVGYRDQKNFAMNSASYNYVLSLDADEELSEQLQRKIIEMKNEGLKYDAYFFNRLNNIGGTWIKHGEWYPDAKIRLWNRKKGEWGGQNVHETVKMREKAVVSKLKLDLLHYPYNNIIEYNTQFMRFARIWAEEKSKANKESSLFSAIFHAFVKFFRGYFFKLGFLDGFYGFVIAKTSAHYTFLKYAHLRELGLKKK